MLKLMVANRGVLVGAFEPCRFKVGRVFLDLFPTPGDARMAMQEQLQKHQASILAQMPPVITPSVHVMMEVRGMVENMFGPGRELACHFVWRGAGGADGWFSRGYKFVYGEVRFNEGATVEDAVKGVRAMYREWLYLRIGGKLRGRNSL